MPRLFSTLRTETDAFSGGQDEWTGLGPELRLRSSLMHKQTPLAAGRKTRGAQTEVFAGAESPLGRPQSAETSVGATREFLISTGDLFQGFLCQISHKDRYNYLFGNVTIRLKIKKLSVKSYLIILRSSFKCLKRLLTSPPGRGHKVLNNSSFRISFRNLNISVRHYTIL